MLKGGHKKLLGTFYAVACVFAILKGGGGQHNSAL